MKIKSFRVKKFKSLFDFSVSKFGNINMIFGLNNCGKSNVLKFIELLFKTKSVGQIVRVGTEENRMQITSTNFWKGEISDIPYLFFNNNLDERIEFEITMELTNNEIPFYNELDSEEFIDKRRNSCNVFIQGNFESINKFAARINLIFVQLNNKTIFKDGEYFPEHVNLSQEHFDAIMSEFNNCVSFLDSNRLIVNNNFTEDSVESDEIKPETFRNSLFELYLYDYDKFLNLFKAITSFKINDQGIDVLKHHLLSSPLEKPEISFTKFKDNYEFNAFKRYGGKDFRW